MRFNLKYLVFPLSIMGCINSYSINAMENIIYKVNQNPMSWIRFERVLTSFKNNEQLNDIQIDFIKRIANEISHNVDINNWRSIIIDGHINFPRTPPLTFWFAQLNEAAQNNIIQQQVNNTNLSNRDILLYIEKTSWLICLDNIPNNNNHNNDIDNYDEYMIHVDNEYNKQVNTYIKFIDRVKDCYKEEYITKNEYISLLNWLLYYNVYNFFNTIRQSLLVTWISENHQTFNNNFANYLLGNEQYDKNKISLIELYKKYASGLSSEIEYKSTLKVINKIIDDLISIHIVNNKLRKITPVNILNHVRYKVLEPIIHGIYDAAYYEDGNGNTQQPTEYYRILNSQTAINKIDSDFDITYKILSLQEYKDYEENFNQFKEYYHGLRRKSSKDPDYNHQDSNKTQYQSFEDVKNKIKTKENKFDSTTKTNKNSIDKYQIPEHVYSKILPYLVHTKFDHKPNNNNVNKINKDSD